MAWFVQEHRDPAGQAQHDGNPKTFIGGMALHLDALRPQVPDRGFNVVAHQGELVPNSRLVGWTFGGMHSELSRRRHDGGAEVLRPD